jgi:YD repeat-containing protein
VPIAETPVATVISATGRVINAPQMIGSGAASFIDRNGNIISANSSGQFFDTLNGTTPALTVAGSGTQSSPITYTYTAPSGASASYTMNSKNYTVATNFGVSGVAETTSYPSAVPIVTSITLPDGSEYTFNYEATPGTCTAVSGTTCSTGRMTSVTLPTMTTGEQILYSYSAGNHGILPDGSAATLTRTTPDGTWTFVQGKGSSAASTTTVTDPQSNVSTIQFQGIYETQRVVKSSTGSTLLTTNTCYNGAASPCLGTAITQPITQRNVSNLLGGGNNKTDLHQQTYDGYGNLLTQTDYDYGSGSHGGLLATTTISYASLTNITAFQQQVTVTNSLGATTSQTYYNYGDATKASTGTPQHNTTPPGSRGNLLSVNYYTTGTNYLTQSFSYYDTGNVYQFTDVNGTSSNLTTYSYSNCGNAFPIGVTEAISSLTQSYGWNCTEGVPTSVKDESGNTASVGYTDAYYWRPNTVTDQLGNQAVSWYQPNPTYCCPSGVGWYLTFGTTTVSNLQYEDSLGRVDTTQKAQSSTSSTLDTVSNTFDTNGRPHTVSLPCSVAVTDSCPNPIATTTYDALNRVTKITAGDGGTTTYQYTDNDVLVTVAGTGDSSKIRQLEYNSLGQLTSVCEVTSTLPGHGICGQTNTQQGYWTTYTYTPSGQIVNVNQNAQTSTQQARLYTYDYMGRLTTETNPESGETIYAYDTVSSSCYNFGNSQAGNLTAKTDANGNTNCFHYDPMHRLSDVSSTRSSNNYCKRFRYDAQGNGLVSLHW